MKKIISLSIVLGVVFGFTLSLASAEEKTEDVKVAGKAVSGIEGISEGKKSSKFFEYRDVPKGFIFSLFDLSVEKGDKYLTFYADRVRQDDARYILSAGDHGKYSLDFTYDKIPHRFSFFGRTLYVEQSPGVYILADPLQAALQNIVGEGGVNASLNMSKARFLLADYIAGAHDIDLGLQRNKGTLNFSYNPAVPLNFKVRVSREERQGTRPFSASFGFSHVVEVPEPIDYKTTDVNARVEYSKKWGTVQAGVFVSMFENEVQTLIWDNPLRITDQTFDVPSGAYSAGNGTATGRMALPPSNTAQKFYLNAAVKPLKSTTLSGAVSYGLFSQNEKLLPFTVNSALVNYYPNALNAPRASAEAEANVSSLDFTLNSKIVKHIYFTAGYRYYNFDNKTEELDLHEGYARFDQNWEDIAIAVEPYKFVRSKFFGDVSLNFLKNTSFRLGYSFSSIDRKLGHEDEGKSDEGTFKASLDTNPLDWLLLRVSYLTAKREWSEEGHKDIYASWFNFKRYHEADRDRTGLNFLAGFSLLKNLDLTASYMSGKDEYPRSDYGLKDNDFALYSLDLTYAFANGTAVYGFYSNEVYEANQASRQSGATISTDTRTDWTAMMKDTVDTFGGGLSTYLVKDKVNLDLSYSYARAKGTSDLYSPPGGTPDVAVNFTKPIDTTKLQTIKAKLLWKMKDNFSVALGYWFEQYDLSDIVRNDYQDLATLAARGSAMYLGAGEPGYRYHVGFLKFICTW